jgi:hypothetical protein
MYLYFQFFCCGNIEFKFCWLIFRNNSIFRSIFSILYSICRFEVCCFGAGPGSEVLGLHPFLPNKTKYHLFDNCTFWEHNAKYLLHKGLNADFDFHHFDVQKKMKKEQFDIIKQVHSFFSLYEKIKY